MLDEDRRAIAGALACDRAAVAAHGASYSWEAATDQFEAALRDAVETWARTNWAIMAA
jgi:hypothetical protein